MAVVTDKFFWLYLLILVIEPHQCTVYLRTKNDRGPLATLSGVKCLWNLTNLYFYENLPTRTKNCVVLHSHNMSAPAYDIEKNYLTMLNTHLAKGRKGYQLRIISDNYKLCGLQNVPSNLITLTDYYVLVTDDFDLFYYNMRNFVSIASAWNPSAKFVILFNNPDIRDRRLMGQKIFEIMKVQFHAANVIILFAVSMIGYEILMANPFAGEACRDIDVKFIGKCEMGEIVNYRLVKGITRQANLKFDLKNCHFYLCSKVTEPFVERDCKSGLEIELVRILTSVMDFKVQTFCTTVERGNVRANGNVTGLLAMIRNNTCDFIVGGFFPDDEVHQEFAVTQTYFQDSYTWFVPLALNRPHWEGLLMIFQWDTWSVLGIIIVLSAISWFIFGLVPHEDFHNRMFGLSFLNSFQVFLGISANNRPISAPLKIFFITLSLYGLNVTTLYTSHLIAVFTREEKYDQINTVEEMLDQHLLIGGRIEYRDWFDNDGAEDQLIFKLYNTSLNFLPTTANLNQIRRTGKYAILANRLYVSNNKIGNQIYGLDANVFSNQLEMITLKGFPLLTRMNIYISRLKDSGLITKIFNDFFYNTTILSHIRNPVKTTLHGVDDDDDEVDHEQVVLTLGHLEGPFAMLIVGIIVSVACFILELISVTPVVKWLVANIIRVFRNSVGSQAEDERAACSVSSSKIQSKRKPSKSARKIEKIEVTDDVVEIRFRDFDNYNKITKLKKPAKKLY